MSGASSLLSLPDGGPWARVLALGGDAEASRVLRAMGLFEGQRVRVLRRGPFGGPVHVRAESGAEFAVDRAVAEHIDVRAEPSTSAAVETGR
jgi:Fe2+ transport system protein FeoA